MEGLTCGCEEFIRSWWEKGKDGRQMLYIDDSNVPVVCVRRDCDPLGDEFAVVAIAASVIEQGR